MNLPSPSLPHLIIRSHGLKRGVSASAQYTLPRAHIYLDCRGALDGAGQAEIIADAKASGLLDTLSRCVKAGVRAILSRRRGLPDPYASPIEILCICAWGAHRSVAMKVALPSTLPSEWKVEVI